MKSKFNKEKWKRIRERTRKILRNCKREGKLIVVDFRKKKTVRNLYLVNGG